MYSYFSYSSSDEADEDADYEDSEYESDSSDSELDEGCANIKLAVPLHPMQQPPRRKPSSKTCQHHNKSTKTKSKSVSSTEQESGSEDSDDTSSSAGDSETESELDHNDARTIDEFSGSETNTECDFTDSEGRPNPFHKELEVPSILIEPGSPEVPGMRRYPEDIIEANSSKTTNGASLENLNYSANRFKYKTPNLTDDLAKNQKSAVANSAYVGRSTQRAFNLKKHWVSDANAHGAGAQNTSNAEKKSDLNNRFNSLMDRLSNQQKLLKPADKPSTQMEHFMKRTSQGTVKSISTDPLITSPLKSPAVIFSRQTSEMAKSSEGQKFTYPPPYRPAMPTTNGVSSMVPTPNSMQNQKFNSAHQEPATKSIQNQKYNLVHQEPVITKSNSEKALFYIDSDKSEEIKEETSVKELEQEPAPPPIPPIPEIYVEKHKALLSEKKSQEHLNKIIQEQKQQELEPGEPISPETNDEESNEASTINTTFESCNENVADDTNEENYMTPANELSLNPEDLKDQDDIPLADEEDLSVAETVMDLQSPLATSSPAIDISGSTEYIKSPTESEKAFILKCKEIKLTDDEIKRIYQEKNPLERLARFNSLKKKQSSVVHGMILSSSANRPRTRRTRVAAPSSSIPPVPTASMMATSVGPDYSTPTSSRIRAATEPPMSLPATPLTDPAKFGIPVARNAKKQQAAANNSPKKVLPTAKEQQETSNKKVPEQTSNKILSQPKQTSQTSVKESITRSDPSRTQQQQSETRRQHSSASDNIEKLDGIVSTSEDGNTGPNSPAKKVTNMQPNHQKKTFMQTISGIFRGSSSTRTGMASPEADSLTSPPPTIQSGQQHQPNNNMNAERKSRSSDFMKFLKPASNTNSSSNNKRSPVSSPEAPRANLSEISNEDTSLGSSSKRSLMIRQSSKLSMKASHPSTPPVPLSRKISIIRNASDGEISSDNEDSELQTSNTSDSSLNIINTKLGKVPPEILEKIMKKGASKSAKRIARVAHLKRVRKAQEIQRQLEELDVMHKELEDRGIEAEKYLRGEVDSDENDNPDLLQTWFILLAEKNALVRHEQELLVQAKQLELEDTSSKLEIELRDHLLLDSRSADSVGREASILQELLSIAEQREKLQSMLERDKKRYIKEDQDIEAQMKAKGLRVAPVRKLSLNMLDTSSTA